MNRLSIIERIKMDADVFAAGARDEVEERQKHFQFYHVVAEHGCEPENYRPDSLKTDADIEMFFVYHQQEINQLLGSLDTPAWRALEDISSLFDKKDPLFLNFNNRALACFFVYEMRVCEIILGEEEII